MKKFLLLIAFSLILLDASAYTRYWIRFTDKIGTPYLTTNPSAYLSARSIQRRVNQGIVITARDFPPNPSYISQVAAIPNVVINYRSRWFNAVCITTSDPNALTAINALPFVVNIQSVKRVRNDAHELDDISFTEQVSNERNMQTHVDPQVLNYGQSFGQANQIGAVCLHNMGYQGQGMQIAILDDGFYHVDQINVFDSIRLNNQILGTWDFVSGNSTVYDDDTHGMEVLSCIGGNLPGFLVGTAPKAKFWLLRTEDAATEYLVEEDNWVAGIEYADSVGADVVNTSLGYTQFDDATMNHVYATDFDGNTTTIARAADYGEAAGMFIVCCAGNSGSSPWHYIWSPADADSILAVGAVDALGNVVGFSSYGPSSNGRIKPNTCATGSNSTVASSTGGITTASGTSFASPTTCGAVACLWQSSPSYNNIQLLNAIQMSANHYTTPDDRFGYGIPNMCNAMLILGEQNTAGNSDQLVSAYPNPFTDGIYFSFVSTKEQTLKVQLLDVMGRIVYSSNLSAKTAENKFELNALQNLSSGLYILNVSSANKIFTKKVVKE